MKVYLVSMPGSERLPGTLDALRYFEIEPEVCVGVKGADLSKEELDELVLRHPVRDILLRKLTPGEIGCSLSHFLAMHQFLESGAPSAWILEDDIRFSRDPRPIMGAIEAWSKERSSFIVNWGGQADPRFDLPISDTVFECSSPAFKVRRFVDMLWLTHCLYVDRAYCEERLAKAIPIASVFDTYGLLDLTASFYVLEEPQPSCDPTAWEEAVPSVIAQRPASLVSKLFPRRTMRRFRLEQSRDRLLRGLVGSRSLGFQHTCELLQRVKRSNATTIGEDGVR